MSMLEDFMTSQEAAQTLNKTSRQITGLCKKGDLTGAIKHGGIWLIPKLAIEIYSRTKARNIYYRKDTHYDQQ